jgi:uncharacterized Zn finger protein
MTTDLDEWITREALEECAGPVVFERGEAYFDHGAVSRLRDAGSQVSARVDGTEYYQTELWTDGEELHYDCTCPHAAEGYFCKHCVAVGLAFLAEREEHGPPEPAHPRDSWASLREYLLLQPPENLVGWLLDAAQRDDGLHRTLLLKAERAGGSVDTVKAFRRAIDQAARVCDPDEWEQLADSLAELLEEPESAVMLVDLAEYAIERLEQAITEVEDEEGEFYGSVERFGELHREACRLARPDPVLLAERLFRYEAEDGLDTFYNSLRHYAEILGPSGSERYRELAEAAWSEVRPVAAGQYDYGDYRRQRITRIMETLAQMAGDVDALAAVKARDLSSAHCYLEIAKLYRDAGQGDKALDWAERGLRAFPERPDNQLRDFLTAAYLDLGRDDEALQLVRVQFEEAPGLGTYQNLQAMADEIGDWPEQREWALAVLETAVQRAANEITRWKPNPSVPDQSVRIQIALWENDLEAAWEALQRGTCHREVLLSLAAQLETARPADAATLYRRVIPNIVGQTGNRAYEQAVGLIRKVGELMGRLGQEKEFADYLAELRVVHKAKRNFIKLLEAMGRGR